MASPPPNPIKPLTAKSYAHKLVRLHTLWRQSASTDEFNTALITNPQEFIDIVNNHYSQGSHSSFYNAIIHNLRHRGALLTQIAVYQAQDVRDRDLKDIERSDTRILTEKETKNWLPWSTIVSTWQKMSTNPEYSKTTDYLIISLYVLQPPVRADYAGMPVIESDIPSFKENHCYMGATPEFRFYKYKNAVEGKPPTIVSIRPHLISIIRRVLSQRTPEGRKTLLTRRDGDRDIPVTENWLSQRVRIIMELWTRVPASINTFRHAYISAREKETSLDRLKDAYEMMHSAQEHNEYIRTVIV